jgi:enoyl-CoA hydratase
MTAVTFEEKNGLAIVTVNRPESLNAINEEVIYELEKITQTLKMREDIHAVVLTGAGTKAFVAGADIKAMSQMSSIQASQFSAYGTKVFESFGNLPQVTITKVSGFALGGGLELAMAADFIVCSENSFFGLPEVTLGLVPGFGGSQRLAQRIGISKAIEWATSGAKYTAQQALQAGLVNSVHSAEEFELALEKLVAGILKNGPYAIKSVKSLIRNGANSISNVGYAFESSQFGVMFSSSDAKEGMKAFVEKRKPNFVGH